MDVPAGIIWPQEKQIVSFRTGLQTVRLDSHVYSRNYFLWIM